MGKKHTFHEVIWKDAHAGALGWSDLETNQHGRRIVSVGILVERNKNGIGLMLSYDAETKQRDGYIFIPHGVIVEINDLGRVPKPKKRKR